MSKIKFDSKFYLKDLGDFVLQGICEVGDYFFISAYDSSNKKDNSIIYILNKNYELIRKTTLYNNSHVGGLCYDMEHDLFWITDKKGTVSGYRYEDIFNNSCVVPKYKSIDVGSKDLLNHKDMPSVAYICYFDKRLFLGNFSNNGNGLLKEFKLKEDGNIDLSTEKKSLFLDNVQGLYLYMKNEDIYLLVSTSFGRYKKSVLKILKYKDIDNYRDEDIVNIEMPSMMEQIIVSKDNKLMSLYESNSKKYKNIFNRHGDICIIDMEKIINNI